MHHPTRNHGKAPYLHQKVKTLPKKFNYAKETKVNDRIIDLVLFTRSFQEIFAIEIKANGDNLKRAISQCEECKKWVVKLIIILFFPENYKIIENYISPLIVTVNLNYQ